MIKKKTLLRTCATVAAVLIVCCFAPATQATTIYVGGCHTNSYATITLAVAAASAGTIIDVCPGYYAEQVTISMDNITLQGIVYTKNGVSTDAAVIIPPSGGFVANATIYSTDNAGPAVAQILVNGVMGVTISHITVDAESTADCGTGGMIGIYYQNSSGTVTDSVARNQSEPGVSGNQCGWGIATDSNGGATSLTVSNSSVHNFQKNGIVARDNTTLTATGNTVTGIGLVAGDAGTNGIEIAFGATGTVKTNYVADLLNNTGESTGILLYSSTGSPVVQGNTVESANIGIGVEISNGASILSNHVGGSQMLDGIDLCGSDETATGNIVYNSTNSGIHLDSTCGAGSGTGETVKSNTINEACAGLAIGAAGPNTTTPNTYMNDAFETVATDGCTLPTTPTSAAKSAGQPATKTGKPRP